MYFELAYNYGNEKAGVPIIDRTKNLILTRFQGRQCNGKLQLYCKRPEKSSRIIAIRQSFLQKTEDLIKLLHGRLWQKYIFYERLEKCSILGK
jgi:hypothetical protein